jgi:hypothetical protein
VRATFLLACTLLLLPFDLAWANATASPGTIPLQGGAARAASVESASTAWGGARTDATVLSDRVVSYQIRAELNPTSHQITGAQTLRWRNRSNVAISTVYLHLYLNGFADTGSTYMHEQRISDLIDDPTHAPEAPLDDGEWGAIKLNDVIQLGSVIAPRKRFVQPDGGPKTDQSLMALDLAQAVPPGGQLVLTMKFTSQLPRALSRTGYFKSFHMVAQWFPKIAVLELPGERGATQVRWNAHEFHLNSEFYADFGSFDVTLTVPKDFLIAATGAQIGAVEALGSKSRYHFAQADVHDFAWAADSRFMPPLRGSFPRAGKSPVAIQVFFTPDYASNAAPALAATQGAMRYSDATLGGYPFDTLSIIVPPFNADGASGMEYPTLYTVEGYTDVSPGSRDAAALEFVAVHEFTHNYFQGILASDEFEEPMLDEGLNQFWNDRYLQSIGKMQPILDAPGLNYSLDRFELARLSAGLADPLDALGQNSWARFSSASFGTVYSRTATMLHDLEARWGAAVMTRAMQTYYQRWKFRHPSVADFKAVLGEVSGDSVHVERLFAQLVYAGQLLDDRLSALSSFERPKSAPAERFESIVTVRHFGLSVPQTLRVQFDDGTMQTYNWPASDAVPRWRRLRFFSASAAQSAELDPHQHYLIDQNLLDNSRKLHADSSASSRWLTELAASLETFYALVLSL